jgi:hypothetical protein
VSAPVGPTGLALQCSGEHGEPPKNRFGLSFGAFQTRLVLGDLGTVALREAAVGASFERRLSPKLTLQLNGGAIVSGQLFTSSLLFRGAFVGGGASFSLVDQKGAIPFVMLGVSLSFSYSSWPETNDGLFAGDVRGAVTAGYTLGGRFTPYVVGRAFGGPVVLTDKDRTRLGTDLYHFQLGAGLVVSLPAGFDLSVELIPLGEQRVSAGVGYSL